MSSTPLLIAAVRRVLLAAVGVLGLVALLALAGFGATPATPEAPQSPVTVDAPVEYLEVEAPQPVPEDRIVLVDEAWWDERTQANVRTALALLPEEVKWGLGNPELGPLYIVISEDGRTRSGYQPYGRAANFFSTNEATNEVVLYPRQSVRTVLHELGHAYNLRISPAGNYAAVFLNEEMQSFMNATGWRVLSSWDEIALQYDHSRVALAYDGPSIWTVLSRDDALEDFANSFALYFSAPEELQALSWARYAWFAERFSP